MIKQKIDEKLLTFTANRTTSFWIKYLNDLVRQHIRAKRIGNWKLNLDSLLKMLPYFVACGYNNCTISMNISSTNE